MQDIKSSLGFSSKQICTYIFHNPIIFATFSLCSVIFPTKKPHFFDIINYFCKNA